MAGTPIVMADGSLKPIEQVKVGEQVLAKSESTGEVSAKKVTQTFQRQAPSTWALSFAGEAIETTAEHPFYVQHKGFVPAGLLAVGNAIVTRAGPALQVLGNTEKKQAAQVYNFSVQDNHTYFVGKSGLWVHNTECTPKRQFFDDLVNNRGLYEVAIETPQGVVTGIAEVSIEGNRLHLSDITIYGQGTEPLTGLRAHMLKFRRQAIEDAKAARFDELRVSGKRVDSSSSANPGHEFDITISLM